MLLATTMAPIRSGTYLSRPTGKSPDTASDYQSSDDGYDYNVVDDAPEAQPTKPMQADLFEPRRSPVEVFASRGPEDADNAFIETMPYIFQRHAGGRRAKIPTDIDMDLESGTNDNATTKEGKQRSSVPQLTNIKLRWTMPEIRGRHVLKINCDKVDVEAQEPFLQRRRVRWQ